MKDIRRKCNPTVDLSKFISNKKILNKVIPFKVCLGITYLVEIEIFFMKVLYK